MHNNIKIAVIGATGLVGREMLKILLEFGYSPSQIICYASKKSNNKIIMINKQKFIVHTLDESFSPCEIALFCTNKKISQKFAPLFATKDCFVIDNSNAFRRNKNIPLIIPEININEISNKTKIIANPNCSTIQLCLPLFALLKNNQIKRIVVSTYQAVSGGGKNGIEDLLKKRTKNLKKFPHPISNNIIPHIDIFLSNGNTLEEDKMIFETKKILNNQKLKISATCARVPIINCHCESVNVEFLNDIDLENIKQTLSAQNGITVIDNPQNNEYPMPIMTDGKNDVFVGRLRVDESKKNAINMWIVADNLRKGAALNAVQIADHLIKEIL